MNSATTLMTPSAQPADPFAAADIVTLARRRAAAGPDQIGYTFLADGETDEHHLTYGELDRRAAAVAARLQSVCAPGERALLLYGPGLDYVVAFFGCLYAGAVPVPAYPPDPLRRERTLPRLRAIADDCHPAAVLGTAESLGWAGPLLTGPLAAATAIATDQLAGESLTPVANRPASGYPAGSPGPDDIAFLQYTSGSTGTPRGVVVSHRNLLHQLACVHRYDVPDAVGLSWLPMYHDLGLVCGVLAPLASGRRVVLLSPLAFVQWPLRWLWAASRYRATTLGAPDFAYALAARRCRPADAAGLDLSCVRVAMTGAETVRPETLEQFTAAFAPYGFRPEAWAPSYGLAEATLGVAGAWRTSAPLVTGFAAAELERGRAVPVGEGPAARRLVSCGPPMADTEVVIVDPRRRVELPAGSVGEVWVRCPGVALGYWNRPEESEATFGARLADAPERGPYLRTGDLGFLHDGELYPVARLKELLIFWGRNVYPQDVEATVTRCHPALKEHGGAAFAVEVNGSEQLVVVQEVTAAGRPDLDQLAAAIRRAVLLDHRVPLYALVFLKPGTLPKTSSGKIQRLEARDRYLRGGLAVVRQWEFGAAAGAVFRRAEGSEPPGEGAIRDWLCVRVAAHCGLSADAIDVTRPLTDYVLDSVTLVALAVELEAWLGGPVEPATIFDAPSAAELARRLAGLTAAPVESPQAVDALSERDVDRALADLLAEAGASGGTQR